MYLWQPEKLRVRLRVCVCVCVCACRMGNPPGTLHWSTVLTLSAYRATHLTGQEDDIVKLLVDMRNAPPKRSRLRSYRKCVPAHLFAPCQPYSIPALVLACLARKAFAHLSRARSIYLTPLSLHAEILA
jgi:hypothetical protein